MSEKSTGDLLEVLKRETLDSAMGKIEPDQVKFTVKELTDKLIAERRVKLADVYKRSGINKSYFYAITGGVRKNPSRDILIRLCFGFGFGLDEAQKFLKTLGAAPLYARNRRDSIIIHALDNKLSVNRCNDNLYEYGEKILAGG